MATFTTIEDLQQAGLSPAELAGAAEEALSVLQQMVDERWGSAQTVCVNTDLGVVESTVEDVVSRTLTT